MRALSCGGLNENAVLFGDYLSYEVSLCWTIAVRDLNIYLLGTRLSVQHLQEDDGESLGQTVFFLGEVGSR